MTGIIFDMDGVILDSNPYHRDAWLSFLRKRGVIIDEQTFIDKIFGSTGKEALRHFLGQDLTDEMLGEYTRAIDAEFRENFLNDQHVGPIKDLKKFLDSVKIAGCRIALATSAPNENVSAVFQKLELNSYFDIIVDQSHITRGKPDPEIYNLAVEKLGLPKEQCVVLEDSLVGVTSAYRAGLKVIGITSTQPESALKNVGASICIEDYTGFTFEDVKKMLA
ncbi:MAG: HAD family phosphatase [Bacteroidales bacterium]|nr:HAD family phosphatase [Bacteroidales bacterium]